MTSSSTATPALTAILPTWDTFEGIRSTVSHLRAQTIAGKIELLICAPAAGRVAVEVRRDGDPLELGGPQQRAVLAHLVLEAGRVVPVDRLISRVWGDEPPAAALGTLQSYISRLRRALEPGRTAGSPARVLASVGTATSAACSTSRSPASPCWR
jgi:DNA-binding response OmpR family regulator